jgi:hypothetical protein
VVPASAAFLVAALPSFAGAQWTASIRVEETAGIRRTSFPVRTSFEIPAGRLQSAVAEGEWRPVTEHVRLEDGGASVPVQATALTLWGDGSVRGLELDFNVSLAPNEARALELHYGPETPADTAEVRGLALTEDESSIQSGRVRFGKLPDPLFLSVAYREELITAGRNRIAITDGDGTAHDGSDIDWISSQIMKPGPLVVHVRHFGYLRLGTTDVPVVVNIEMPSSKSWVQVALTVEDSGQLVREVAIETPLALGPHPWSWDWGTPNGTYGALRDADGSMVLTERIDSLEEGSWQIATGPRGEERPYEASDVGGYNVFQRWGHLVGPNEAVAFAARGLSGPGTFTAAFDGSGQTTFRFARSEPGYHALTLYQHYVSTPVSIGAATSPASILRPPTVSVEP